MSSSKVQRVCNACKYRCDSQSTTSFEQLPFSAFVIVSSFLPIASVASLSCVSKSVHRIFTSRDFDLSFWQYAWNRTQSKRSSPYVFLSHNMTVPHDELHLGIRDSNSLPTLEIETLYDTSAFRWRLKYMEDIAVFQSVGNALFFMQHPIVLLRTAAMRKLRKEICKKNREVMEAMEKPEIMAFMIKYLQLGNSEMKWKHTISSEMQQFILMTASCLINITQTSNEISVLFRNSEGITTVLSFIENQLQNSPLFPPSELLIRPQSPNLSEGNNQLTRKVILYLTGILINVSRSDKVSCDEIGQLRGMEILTQLMQLTQEKQSIYCLECIKACCHRSELCKDVIGTCGGIIKIINCLLSLNIHVIISALHTLTCILSNHPANQRLFCLANGMNALMQVEESWRGVCSIQAAKTISNVLNNPSMVQDFLQHRGIERIEQLIRTDRADLAGYLLGQLMNCAMYGEDAFLMDESLLKSMLDLLESFCRIANDLGIFPGENSKTAPATRETSPSREQTLLVESVHVVERVSSFSDDTHNELSLLSSGSQEETEKRSGDLQVKLIPLFLGYGAGVFCYLSNYEVNCSLFVKYGVEQLLEEMQGLCDTQGHIFITQTLERLHKVASKTYVKQQGPFSSPELESVVVVEEHESNMISPP